MSGKKLAETIITVANKAGGYVFGGYVRDAIAREDFNDVDIYLPGTDTSAIKRFVDFLKNMGLYAMPMSKDPKTYTPGLERAKYKIGTPAGYEVIVDFVISRDPDEQNPFRMGKDADVNFLFLDGAGNSHLAACMGETTTLDKVIQHINDREYEAPKSVTRARIAKIESKGYVRVGNPKREELVLKAIKNRYKCQGCQDKKVIDLGLYKRLCMDCYQPGDEKLMPTQKSLFGGGFL